MTSKTPITFLSLGWGVQSWTIAAMMALGELPRADYLVHADTTHERQATYEFAEQWTPWLGEHGLDVVTVTGTRTDVVEYWQKEAPGVMIPAFTDNLAGDAGQVNRQCTYEWKISAVRRYMSTKLAERGLKKTPAVTATVLGISWDEALRIRDSDVKYNVNEYPLVDARIRRSDCVAWLEAKGLPVPVKSSCVFCPYQSKVSWERLARANGPDWDKAVRVDEAIRNKRDNFELFVHPSRRPLPEAVSNVDQMEMWPDASCDGGYCFV